MCLSVISLPLRISGRSHVAYGVAMAIPMMEEGVILAEVDMWQFAKPYLPVILAPNTGEPKPRGEWMLAGSAYAEGGPQKSWVPEVRLGQASKQLRVHGPRQWNNGQLSEPQPVSSVEMRWQAAWGGASVPENPLGCGVRHDSDTITVPSIELPDHPWRNPDESSRPACTLPLDVWHPSRRAHQGTYGSDYLERYFPGMPADFERRFFNRAPEDQQIEHMWRGDESYVLRHWHPAHACIEHRLPGLRLALHVGFRGAPLQRVDTDLTTVWFFPEALMVVLVFNGWVPSRTLDGSDIDRVIAGVEQLGTAMHPVSHYEELWQARTQRTVDACLRAMDDSNLCPPGFVTRFATLDEAMARAKVNPALAQMGERMAKQWESVAKDLQEVQDELDSGFHQALAATPGLTLTPPDRSVNNVLQQLTHDMADRCRSVPAVDLRKKPHEIFEGSKRQSAALVADLEALRAKLQGENARRLSGLDLEKMEQDWVRMKDVGALGSSESLKSPKQLISAALGAAPTEMKLSKAEVKDILSSLDAQAIRDGTERLRDMGKQMKAQGGSPEEVARLERWMSRMTDEMEKGADETADGADRLVESVRAYGSLVPQLPALVTQAEGEDPDAYSERFLRETKPLEFVALDENDLIDPDSRCQPGVRLADRSVGQWRLRGLDLSGAVMEDMTFINCDFRACNLSDSVWRRTTLINCDLTDANLEGAQFDAVSLQWCCIDGVNASRSRWGMSRLLYGMGRRVDWRHSQWLDSICTGVDLSDTLWQHCHFTRVITQQCRFGVAHFLQCQAMQATWGDCELAGSVWDHCQINRCNFYMSRLPRSWVAASLKHICFRESQLDGGNWRDARMEGVDFGEARMRDCDFSGLQAQGLYALQADFRGSNFSNAKIDNGILIGADLRGSCFAAAALRQCWLGLARQDDKTDFAGADLVSANFHPKPEPEKV
jgi:uncharacterized protein YjbI with pentapeptide repeats